MFNNELSKEIFNLTYANEKDNTIEKRLKNVAKAVADVETDENKKKEWEEKFYELLADFKFIPGGRIISNAGLTNTLNTTLINCFVDGFLGEDKDSLENIMTTLHRQAIILKSEGGYGINFSVLRPRGSYVEGIGNYTPGVCEFIRIWNTNAAVITKGSNTTNKQQTSKKQNIITKNKIRKGAQMGVLDIWHPDIEEFITLKENINEIQYFNLSVGIYDDFIDAVVNDKEWRLIFPDYINCKETYKKEWDGNIKKWIEKGYPILVYKTYNSARELYNLIIKKMYETAEPGLLFVDTINRRNNLNYCEYINTTNPCGEQPLPVGGACNLGSINLTQFINKNQTDFDYDKLSKYIPYAVRFLDNVLEISNVPYDYQREEIKNKRRIGIGITGYASALAILKLKYGSDEAIAITEKLMQFIRNNVYKASVELAKEKGQFPLFDKNKYNYQYLDKTIVNEIKTHGLRNSHTMSVQPTGNTSLLANNVSSGIEPIFSKYYYRDIIITTNNIDNNIVIPVVDWENKKIIDKNVNNWSFVNDTMLQCEYDNVIYRYDKTRGLLKNVRIEDYSIKQYGEDNITITPFNELTIQDHLSTLETISKYVDGAVSKTINLPATYPITDLYELVLKYAKNGVIKGLTVYREGSRQSVISIEDTANNKLNAENKIRYRNAYKRKKELIADLHIVNNEWLVFIGLDIDEYDNLVPYEIFAVRFKENTIYRMNTEEKESIDKISKLKKELEIGKTLIATGILTKKGKGTYEFRDINNKIYIRNIIELFDSNEQQTLTRMVSIALRHGVELKYIIEQLSKGANHIYDFGRLLIKILKKYIKNSTVSTLECPNCHNKLYFVEGCLKCMSCGYSLC